MNNEYKPTIGLEIHAELKTKTKMFCNSKNDPEEKRPNVNVCSVCMAHPGTLPVINKEAIKNVLKVGVALNGKIADFTEFDRKNYFYPDIPKGYQISQYKHPLVVGGELAGVKITRIHLEEDTAKSVHDRGDFSLIDFNRAGVPLMELVTEPVITSGEQAVKFAKELQLILRYLNVSDADMEKGQMRVEANISVAPKSQIDADDKTQIYADNKMQIDADDKTQMNADKEGGLLYEDLTYKIRGIVFSIYNQLGSGHKESVYQNALEEEFRKNDISYQREKNIAVIYDNKKIGSYQPDFVVGEKIILEIKALPFIGKIEKKQMEHYLKGSKYKLGLLINFGADPIHIKRIIYDSIRGNPHVNPRESILNDISEKLHVNPRESILGTKVEIKNLNSFKSVGKAIDYEIKRQEEVLNRGEEIKQETRGWDENKQITFSQREKESSHDYRYFPEPDLPKLKLGEIKEFSVENLKKEMTELPWEKRERYKKSYEIKDEDIEFYIANKKYADFFEEVADELKEKKELIKIASNYITSDIAGMDNGADKFGWKLEPKNFAKLVRMIDNGQLSSRAAKDILVIMYDEGGDPEIVVQERGISQISDENKLKDVVKDIINENKSVADDYKRGKESSLQYLIGQGMKITKGSANPKILEKLLKEIIG